MNLLLNTLSENSELEIIPMIENNMIKNILINPFMDNVNGKLERVEVLDFLRFNFHGCETIVFRNETDEIVDYFIDIFTEVNAEFLTDEEYIEVKKKATQKVANLEWKKGVFLFINK
jgi:hypothetical protein